MSEKISILYPVRYAVQEITKAEYDLILALHRLYNDRVQAIKFIRAQYNLGLKEAKDLCDTILERGPQ